MTTKQGLIAITGVLTIFAGLPISLTMQYLLYKHIQAPQVIWTLWIIQIPILILMSVLSEISKSIKE